VVIGLIVDATDLIGKLPGGEANQRLNGDVNIAVARFVGLGSPEATVQAAELSASLATDLRRRASADRGRLAPTVEVAGPETVGAMTMASADGQEELDRLNATIGVSGGLRGEPQATVLSVVIRVNERQLHLAQQIDPVIRQRVRMAGAIDESIATRIRVRGQLVETIDQVGSLLLGLGELESGHTRRARELLGEALLSWPADSGQEALQLLLGHALAQERRYARARSRYRRALNARPGYVRARFALAALDFQTATADCSRGNANVRVLSSARKAFNAIAREASSTLRTKALFARARADACLSQTGLFHRFALAKVSFESVVEAYDSGTPDVRQEAAESLGWLAFIFLPARGVAPRSVRGSLSAAAGYYRRAAALAIDPSRRRFFAERAQRWGSDMRLDEGGDQ
jgi:tetratricopeptide (TPR) repeat protein